MEKKIKTIEWAAALFEGEGWISPKERGWQVAIASSDIDVRDAFYNIVKVGKIYGPYRRKASKPHHKSMYEWKVTKPLEVVNLLQKLLPYFCERRSQRATEAIESLKSTYEIIN